MLISAGCEILGGVTGRSVCETGLVTGGTRVILDTCGTSGT